MVNSSILSSMILFVFLCALSNSVFALPDDKNKIAQLAADTADLNQQTHQGIYIGNVNFDQGTTHLRAARARTEGNEKNKLIFAVAFGDNTEPAHYWTQTDLDKPLLHAYADEIRYYPERHLIELIGNAKVTQDNNSLTAEKITYDTVSQHVVSEGTDDNKRTTFIFHPGTKL